MKILKWDDAAKGYWLAAAAALASAFLFAFLAIGDLRSPITGGPDIDQYEYTGTYVAKNIRLAWVPVLRLETDSLFYPYGVNAVLQPWSVERDLYYAAFDRLFGPGPWLKHYLLLSLFAGCFGGFCLLRRRFPAPAAFAAAWAATFGAFMALQNYPDQYLYAVLHWMTLGIMADFLLARDLAVRRTVSARLLALRLVLLVLALGLDLNCVANYSLVSFTLTLLFLLLYLAAAALRRRAGRGDGAGGSWAAVRLHRAGWRRLAPLLAPLLLAAWLYVPLDWQIVGAIRALPRPGDEQVVQGMEGEVSFDAHPARVLLPFFPRVMDRPWFDDWVSHFGSKSVGWSFLFPAVLALFLQRRRWLAYVPLAVFFALLLFYSPQCKTLKIFPWARFSRQSEMVTLAFPAVFALAALGLAGRLAGSGRAGKVFLALLAGLFALEAGTVYARLWGRRLAPPRADFLPFMRTVGAAPGEAVLDWPFCVAGGNGIATGEVGRYWHLDSYVGALSRFHGKKAVGFYFGRLLPSQFQAFLLAGWSSLFKPDDPGVFRARRQRCGFSPAEWEFFTEFYQKNDFCGICLYPDLLAPGDEREFFRRFGGPVAETAVPRAGRVLFLPRPAAWRTLVDKDAGRSVFLKDGRTFRLRGEALLRAGRNAEAERLLSGALGRCPGDAGLYNLAGIAAALCGRADLAVPRFEEALRLAPGLEAARKNLARARARAARPAAVAP